MNEILDQVIEWIVGVLPDSRLGVVVIAMLPLVETRLAIPFALRCDLGAFSAFFYAFLGSSIMVPILLLGFLPLVRGLTRLRIFSRLGTSVLEKFNEKASRLRGGSGGAVKLGGANENREESARGGKFGGRGYLGILIFSALPLPLTGVWTASAVAAVLELDFRKSLVCIVTGNGISSILLTLLCTLFFEQLNLIIMIISAAAILVVITLLIKSLKKQRQ